jgi:hypothetical protein
MQASHSEAGLDIDDTTKMWRRLVPFIAYKKTHRSEIE